MHDGDDGGVTQDGGHPPNNRLTEICSTFLIYNIMSWSIDICQIKLPADQYHMTRSRAQVYSTSRSSVLLKLTADQVLVFDWIAGSCQVKLLKTELGCQLKSKFKSKSNYNCFFYTFFLQLLFCVSVLRILSSKWKAKQYTKNLMLQSHKTHIKIQPHPGLAWCGYRRSAFRVT